MKAAETDRWADGICGVYFRQIQRQQQRGLLPLFHGKLRMSCPWCWTASPVAVRGSKFIHFAECFPPPAAVIIGRSKDEQKRIKNQREGDWQAMHEELRPGEKQRRNLKSHRPFLMIPLQRGFHTRRFKHYSSLNTLEGAGRACPRG